MRTHRPKRQNSMHLLKELQESADALVGHVIMNRFCGSECAFVLAARRAIRATGGRVRRFAAPVAAPAEEYCEKSDPAGHTIRLHELWNVAMENMAIPEGWNVFTNTSSGTLEIQRLDEMEPLQLDSDGEAVEWAIKKALGGSVIHLLALLLDGKPADKTVGPDLSGPWRLLFSAACIASARRGPIQQER